MDGGYKIVRCWCSAFELVFIDCRVQIEGNDDEGGCIVAWNVNKRQRLEDGAAQDSDVIFVLTVGGTYHH